MSQKPQLGIAHLLVWTAAVACLVWYIQCMPPGTMIPDRSLWSMFFAIVFAAVGGMGLAGLVWFLPKSGGFSYFWYGNRGVMTYLQFLSPIVAAVPLACAVIADLIHNRRPAAHWFGIVLFLIAAGQTLHFGGWHRMFGLLIAPFTYNSWQ